MAFSKQKRLKKDKDIKALFAEGKAVRGVFSLIKAKQNPVSKTRIMISVPAKIEAVSAKRNRIKRIVLECLKKNEQYITGSDIAVVLLKVVEPKVLISEIEKIIKQIKR